MKLKLVHLLLFAIFSYSIHSQTTLLFADSLVQTRANDEGYYNNNFANILPVTPTSGELMKYANIPVDLSRGIPQIEIPIYTIECGEISFPITLTYHAGGIKVDQLASWVGLGWSLNAGGIISSNCIDKRHGLFESRTYDLKNKKEMREFGELYGFSNSYSVLLLLDNLLDRQTVPDFGTYNFMGHSGRFFYYDSKVFDLDGNRELQFKQIYSAPLSSVMTAIDLKGHSYEFDKRNSATTYSCVCGSISNNNFNSYDDCFTRINPNDANPTWGRNRVRTYSLTKITDSNKKDSICLSYKTQDFSYRNMGNAVMSRMEGQSHWTDYWCRPRPGVSYCSVYKNETFGTEANVEEIIASNGVRVVFSIDKERDDLLSKNRMTKPKALSQIRIFAPNGELLKRWTFHYEYFSSVTSHPITPSSNLRLKLKSVKEYGSTQTSQPKIYTFAYYGEEANEPKMPFRESYVGHDFSGYCNGTALSNSPTSYRSSFPKCTPSSPYNPTGISYSGGSNLDVNQNYSHAYSLKSIQYPTQGKRVFKYESNVVGPHKYGGLRIAKIINYFSAADSSVQAYEYMEGYVTEYPQLLRKRSRDRRANSPDPAYSHNFTIYDISSTPFSNLASITGGGVVIYPSVKEVRDDAVVNYYYGWNDGDDLYTCDSYPTDLAKMTTLTVDYYDNYAFTSSLPALFGSCKNYVPNVSDPEHTSARGMRTGGKVALLDDTSQYLWCSVRYDVSGLPVQCVEMNSLGGLNKEFVRYSFTGKPLERRVECTVTGVADNASLTRTYI